MNNLHLLLASSKKLYSAPFLKSFTCYQTNNLLVSNNRIINMQYYYLLIEEKKIRLVRKKDLEPFREICVEHVEDVEWYNNTFFVVYGDKIMVLDKYLKVLYQANIEYSKDLNKTETKMNKCDKKTARKTLSICEQYVYIKVNGYCIVYTHMLEKVKIIWNISAIHSALIYSSPDCFHYLESKYEIPNIQAIYVVKDIIVLVNDKFICFYLRMNGKMYNKTSLPMFGNIVYINDCEMVIVRDHYEYQIKIIRECAINNDKLVFRDDNCLLITDLTKGIVPLPFFHYKMKNVDAWCVYNGKIITIKDGNIYVDNSHIHTIKHYDRNNVESFITISSYIFVVDNILFIVKNIIDLSKKRIFAKILNTRKNQIVCFHIFKIFNKNTILASDGNLFESNADFDLFKPIIRYDLSRICKINEDLIMSAEKLYRIGSGDCIKVSDFMIKDRLLYIIRKKLEIYTYKDSSAKPDMSLNAIVSKDNLIGTINLHIDTTLLSVINCSVLLCTYSNFEQIELPYLMARQLDKEKDINKVLQLLKNKSMNYKNFKNICNVERKYENFCIIWDGMEMKVTEDEYQTAKSCSKININDAAYAENTACGFIKYFVTLNDPLLSIQILLKCGLLTSALEVLQHHRELHLLQLFRKQFADDEIFNKSLLLFNYDFIEWLKISLDIKVFIDKDRLKFSVYDYLKMYEHAFHAIDSKNIDERKSYIQRHKLWNIATNNELFYKLALPYLPVKDKFKVLYKFEKTESIKFAKKNINILWRDIIDRISDEDIDQMSDYIRSKYYLAVGKVDLSILFMLRCDRVEDAFNIYKTTTADILVEIDDKLLNTLTERCKKLVRDKFDSLHFIKREIDKLENKYKRIKELDIDDMTISTTQSKLRGESGIKIKYQKLLNDFIDISKLEDVVMFVQARNNSNVTVLDESMKSLSISTDQITENKNVYERWLSLKNTIDNDFKVFKKEIIDVL